VKSSTTFAAVGRAAECGSPELTPDLY